MTPIRLRFPKWFALLGIGMAPIFLSGVFFWVDCLINGPPNKELDPWLAAAFTAFFGMVVAGILFLTLYMIAAPFVEYVEFDETKLMVRTVFGRKEIALADVTTLNWSNKYHRPMLRLRTVHSKVSIDFTFFAREGKLALFQTLRNAIPHERQQGWDAFCHRFALPLREGRSARLRDDPDAKEIRIDRTRYDRVFAFSMVGLAVLGGALGWLLEHRAPISFPFVVIPFWIIARLSIPKEGDTQVVSPSDKRAMRYAMKLFGFGFGVFLIGPALTLFGVPQELALSVTVIASMVVVFFVTWRFDKSEKRHRAPHLEKAIQEADALWRAGEPSDTTKAL